jgi:elongation factor Ts
MAEVTATLIKDLRERTGAGMADCKKALTEVGGDMDKAIDYLRTKGLAKAAKKAGREATEGAVVSYIHGGGRIGVLVEINCETDFVARNEEFNAFGRSVCLTAAAYAPTALNREAIDPAVVKKEREIAQEQALQTMKGKPQAVIDKAVEGKLEKFFQSKCLMELVYVNPADQAETRTIEQVRQELVGKIGENIQVRRFTYLALGG